MPPLIQADETTYSFTLERKTRLHGGQLRITVGVLHGATDGAAWFYPNNKSGPDFWDLSCVGTFVISLLEWKNTVQEFCSTLTPSPHWPVVGSLGNEPLVHRWWLRLSQLRLARHSQRRGKPAGALLIRDVEKKPQQRNCLHLRVSNDVWGPHHILSQTRRHKQLRHIIKSDTVLCTRQLLQV